MSGYSVYGEAQYAPLLLSDPAPWLPLIAKAQLHRAPAGEIVCQHHGQDGKVVLVKSGVVAMSFNNEDGSDRIHFLGGAGYVFGFRSCISGRPYGGALTAVEPSVLYKIPSAFVMEQMQKDAQFFRFVMYGEYERGLAYSRKLEFLALPTGAQKAASLLLSLAAKTGVPEGAIQRIPLRLTHDIIAKMIYSDRVTVSRILSRFEKEKMVEKRRGAYYLLDKENLQRVLNHGLPPEKA